MERQIDKHDVGKLITIIDRAPDNYRVSIVGTYNDAVGIPQKVIEEGDIGKWLTVSLGLDSVTPTIAVELLDRKV